MGAVNSEQPKKAKKTVNFKWQRANTSPKKRKAASGAVNSKQPKKAKKTVNFQESGDVNFLKKKNIMGKASKPKSGFDPKQTAFRTKDLPRKWRPAGNDAAKVVEMINGQPSGGGTRVGESASQPGPSTAQSLEPKSADTNGVDMTSSGHLHAKMLTGTAALRNYRKPSRDPPAGEVPDFLQPAPMNEEKVIAWCLKTHKLS